MSTTFRLPPSDFIPRMQRRPTWAASSIPSRKRWTTIHRDSDGNVLAETVNLWMTARAWREYQEAYPEETTWQAMPFGDFILAHRVMLQAVGTH
jgi:hypothetical protein